MKQQTTISAITTIMIILSVLFDLGAAAGGGGAAGGGVPDGGTSMRDPLVFQDCPRDDEPLYLIRPFVDLQQFSIAHVFFDLVL